MTKLILGVVGAGNGRFRKSGDPPIIITAFRLGNPLAKKVNALVRLDTTGRRRAPLTFHELVFFLQLGESLEGALGVTSTVNTMLVPSQRILQP